MPPNKPRRFERRPPKREEGGKIIIVCEGSKTEKYYFNAIRVDLRLTTGQIAVSHPNGTNPRLIVKSACEKRREQIDENAWNEKTDNAWAVYDGVEHFRTDPAGWHEALTIARDHKINLAITNPSFELYYLLHFQDQTGWLERDVVKRKLEDNWIKNYEKNVIYYPELLKPLTDAAVDRARKIAKYAKENNLELHKHLCAEGVADLVVSLHKLAKPS